MTAGGRSICNAEDQARLLANLQRPELFDHPVERFALMETHISWVLLTGPFAYKIKKPVDFGFLDYSTLERRRHYCEEELRLNRRYAPQLYLAVVPITGTLDSPHLCGPGPTLEYAVKMRQFDQSALLSRQLEADALGSKEMDCLARVVARFHDSIEQAPGDSPFGEPANVFQPVRENFEQMRPLLQGQPLSNRLAQLEQWSSEHFHRFEPLLRQRKQQGQVRECHGDLHLNNIALVNGDYLPFDGIEFNPNLRFIDTVSETAFLLMDLEQRGRADLAWRFLNTYLEWRGDFGALALLRFYQVYRAMVRAKVASLRLAQENVGPKEREEKLAEVESYVALAEHLTRPLARRLVITHGLSGSGKSTLAAELVQRWGAIRVRSDVERKRLYGLTPDQPSGSAVGAGIYTREASECTYTRLAELAQTILAAGFPVIVDATFLRAGERARFAELARCLGVPFTILETRAAPEVLRARIAARREQGADVSEASLEVLEGQLKSIEPLTAQEREMTLVSSVEEPMEMEALLAKLMPH